MVFMMHLGLPKDIPVQYHQYIPICTGRVPKTAFVSPASDSGRLLDRLNPEAIHHFGLEGSFLGPNPVAFCSGIQLCSPFLVAQ